jgi:soluble lytic murein transglycosylase
MRARSLLPVVALLACACRGGSVPEARPAAEPAAIASTAVAVGDAGAPADAGVDVEAGLPRLAVVLDDPRLAAARERERAHDWSAAARAVDQARVGAALDAPHACTWAYLAGRLYLEAGEPSEAVVAFQAALGTGGDAGGGYVLRPYAALRLAQALVRAGRPAEATELARSVEDDVAAHDEARLALADAYVGKGTRADALPVWRALLAASPHGLRWADSSLQLAGALLDGVDGPPRAHAQEALDLTTRVVVEAPMVGEKPDVTALRGRASAALGQASPPALTPEERARQAQAWLDASQPKKAAEVADALLKALPQSDTQHRDAACKVATVRARAVPHGKSAVAADAWGAAIARCTDDEALATALYYGGKASVSAHRNPEALERFARIEKSLPSNHLADDARFRAAQVVLDQGNEAESLAMLESVADAYPDGDMKGESLFRVALSRLAKGDTGGAGAELDRIVAMSAGEASVDASGRAAYFRARVAELRGDASDARARYASIVAEHPLSYYMLEAYGRLRATGDATARSAIDGAVSREDKGPFLTTPHPELASLAFERFKGLLEVGELDAARREATEGKLVADGVDPEVLWSIGWLYDRAGIPEWGHALARSRLLDFRAHWPAGRWRVAWQVAFPQAWGDLVSSESSTAGIPAPLTWAIMREESAFNPDARSAANAIGLMQLMSGTAGQLAHGTPLVVDDTSLRRPDVSIPLGARLLASLRASFSANPALAIAAYNSGSGAVRRWLGERGGDDFDVFVERIPFEETRNYLKHVLSSEAAYAYLYAPKTLDELLALPQRAAGGEPVASP